MRNPPSSVREHGRTDSVALVVPDPQNAPGPPGPGPVFSRGAGASLTVAGCIAVTLFSGPAYAKVPQNLLKPAKIGRLFFEGTP